MHRSDIKKEAAAKKLEQEKLQIILNELLKDEENKYCADCEAKGPRWASWNIGVFLCIRCAGIHRNLGVHVSKVKSVNLDTWTPEQVQSIRIFGNSVAKAVYETHLPEHFRRPQTDSALETFIRAKYEHKRYSMKDWQPPKIDVRPLLAELENFHTRKKVTSSPALTSLDKVTPSSLSKEGAKIRIPKENANKTLSGDQRRTKLDSSASDDKNLPVIPKPASNKTKSEASCGSLADDLLGLNLTPSASNAPLQTASLIDDCSADFGAFAAAHPSSVAVSTPSNLGGSANGDRLTAAVGGASSDMALIDAGAKGANEKKTKDDIMALYASSGSSLIGGTSGGLAVGPQPAYGAFGILPTGNLPAFGVHQYNQQQPSSFGFGQVANQISMPQAFAPSPANFAAFNPFNQSPATSTMLNFSAPPIATDGPDQQTVRLKAVQNQLAALQSQKTTTETAISFNGSNANTANGNHGQSSSDLWQ